MLDKQPLKGISVVIPSYNHASFISRCIKSILNQTYPPLEIIVIDDGSTDNSIEVIEETLKDCQIPTLLHIQTNQGLCKTLNKGLELAKGDFFAYLGSDDIWLPSFLESRIKILNTFPNAVLAYGNAYIIDQNDQIVSCTKDWKNYEAGKNTKEKLLYYYPPTSATVVYRKSFLEKQKWNPDIKLEDYDLYLRLSTLGEFIFDNVVLSAWRVHNKNTSKNVDFMFGEILAALDRNADILGLSYEELNHIKSQRYFENIDYFVRNGERFNALTILVKHFAGRKNFTDVFKKILKIISPVKLMDFRDKLSTSKNSSNDSTKIIINE